jgi:hypothetical protein
MPNWQVSAFKKKMSAHCACSIKVWARRKQEHKPLQSASKVAVPASDTTGIIKVQAVHALACMHEWNICAALKSPVSARTMI